MKTDGRLGPAGTGSVYCTASIKALMNRFLPVSLKENRGARRVFVTAAPTTTQLQNATYMLLLLLFLKMRRH